MLNTRAGFQVLTNSRPHSGDWEVVPSGSAIYSDKEARRLTEPFICFDDPNEKDLMLILERFGKLRISLASPALFLKNSHKYI